MEQATKKIKNYSVLFLSVSVSCLVICGLVIFVGGLSYQNPHVAFGELFQPDLLKNYISTFIPLIK